jgi:membrane fusion protein (multidrug efflux system)
MKIWTGAALLGALVLTAWAQQRPAGGGGAAPGGAAAPVAVELAPVRQEAALDTAQAVGSLRAAQTTLLRPEVAGRIVRLNVSDGARVSKGQLLVQLDDGVQQAQLAQALAQAATADSNVRRQLELQAQGFVSGSSVEQAQSAAQVAQAQVHAWRARSWRACRCVPPSAAWPASARSAWATT